MKLNERCEQTVTTMSYRKSVVARVEGVEMSKHFGQKLVASLFNVYSLLTEVQ